MGSFAGYFGDRTIPEDKRPEFSRRMLTILRQGGMMALDEITLCGKTITLLCPPDVDQTERFCATYNYFEHEGWEDICYDPITAKFTSEKVGSRQFRRVTHAAHLLYEFYTGSLGAAHVDGYILPSVETIGWFNTLFGTEFTNQRAVDIWSLYRLAREHNDWFDRDLSELPRELPAGCLDQRSYFIYRFVLDPEGTIAAYENCSRASKYGSYMELPNVLRDITDSMQRIVQYDAGLPEAEKLKVLISCILTHKEDERLEPKIHTVLRWAQHLPTEVTAAILAKAFNADFWPLLRKLEVAYCPGNYFLDPYVPCPPEDPIPTKIFLRCSNDDRAYFWTPDGDVYFSRDMTDMLSIMRKQMDQIAAQEGELLPPKDFMERLITVLSNIQQDYGNVFAFSSMFYEFLTHSDDRPVQAALLWLERLAETLKDEGDLGQNILRRYLAVLANKELRQREFGF